MLPGGGGGVGVFWVLLSCCLLAACSLGFLSPAWIVRDGHHQEGVSFGLLWRCPPSAIGTLGAPCPEEEAAAGDAFSALGSFAHIPSSSWQTSAVLCGGGCLLLAVSALLAVAVLFLPGGQCERRVCTLAAYIQMAAVSIMAFGLLVYPFGLASAAVRKRCGNAGVYYAGDCQIGWGYMLAIVGVMLSVFLPFFAKYTPKEQASPTPIPTIL
ncbi:LHFPL tetraspan subfamily member 7 protein [Anolis carolinensis]|uniref:LHFPL tetraspan subfamily member 7 protein n=1 Tax=Anolis carolinensis TaxID=28377 RepID=UPI002F2B53D5